MTVKAGESVDDIGIEERRERLQDLPPSAKLAAKILAEEGPLPLAGVAKESMLPDRTARYAVNRLQEVGLLDVGYDPGDARRRVYALRGETLRTDGGDRSIDDRED